MANPMRIRAARNDARTDVKVLMSHPMETGLRKDASGTVIPALHIVQVTAKCNERVVLAAQWGPAVSQNPFLQFSFTGGAAGDVVSVTWTDTAGDSRTDQITLT